MNPLSDTCLVPSLSKQLTLFTRESMSSFFGSVLNNFHFFQKSKYVREDFKVCQMQVRSQCIELGIFGIAMFRMRIPANTQTTQKIELMSLPQNMPVCHNNFRTFFSNNIPPNWYKTDVREFSE